MKHRIIWTAMLVAALNTGTGLLHTATATANTTSPASNRIYPSHPSQAPLPQAPGEAEEPAPNEDSFPDYSVFTPLEMPEVQEVVAAASAADRGVMISYDVATGEETITTAEAVAAAEALDAAETESHAPPLPFDVANAGQGAQEIVAPSAFNGLTPVGASDTYPWSPTVKLYIITGNNAFGTCSGAMIDPHWVLTVGHCIHDKTSGWAKSVRVVPAYASGAEPFQYARSVSLNSFVGWTRDQDHDWDMGFIFVDRPIGALTGWYGFGYNSTSSFFTQQRFTSTGYPTEAPYDGTKMYTREGAFDNVSSEVVYHNNWTYGGQNGSPYWLTSSKTIYAVAATRSSTNSGQTRLSGAKFDVILAAIKERVPATFNLTPLTTQLNSSSVGIDGALSRGSFLLHNYSSAAWNGAVNVKVYLSSNQIISSSDLLLGTVRYQGQLAAKDSAWVQISGLSIPASVRGGNYWIGMILDSSDANSGDNITEERWVAPLRVPFRLYLPLIIER